MPIFTITSAGQDLQRHAADMYHEGVPTKLLRDFLIAPSNPTNGRHEGLPFLLLESLNQAKKATRIAIRADPVNANNLLQDCLATHKK